MVAVQQSRAPVRVSGAPGRGSRCSLGPRAAPPPQLLEQGGAALLCCPPRVVPGKRAWLHSPQGPGGGGAGEGREGHLCHHFSPNLPFLRGPVPSHVGKPWAPRGCVPAAGHISWGAPIHPFPVREEGEGCQVVPSLCRAQGVQLTEEKPPLPPARNLPDPREIQEEALMTEGW